MVKFASFVVLLLLCSPAWGQSTFGWYGEKPTVEQSAGAQSASSPNEWPGAESAVYVRASDKQGSGVILARKSGEPIVVSCGHIFEGSGGGVQIQTSAGIRSGKLIRLLPRNGGDVSTIDVDWQQGDLEKIKAVRLASRAITAADRITAVGYPGGVKASTTAKLQYRPNAKTTYLRAVVVSGYSGGPALNESGELVGIIWGTFWPQEPSAAMVSYKTVCGIIEQTGNGSVVIEQPAGLLGLRKRSTVINLPANSGNT